MTRKAPAKPRKRAPAKSSAGPKTARLTREQIGALHFVSELGEMYIRYMWRDGRHERGITLAGQALAVLRGETLEADDEILS